MNEDILKNKNIHSYYKRNDKRWFDIQNTLLKVTVALTEVANMCLLADNQNKIIQSKDVVTKVIDAITLLGKVHHQVTFERKERLKSALSEDYKTLCEQDHSGSKFLFGDDLTENVKKG